MLDGRGEPFVTDFGLAKWLDTTTDLTRTLTIFGTPGYIAPEQAKGPAAELTPAADVYSLGAILFDLFTGRPPFLGEHALAVIQQASENRRRNCARSRRHWIATWKRSARVAWSASHRRAIARLAIWLPISNAGWKGARSLHAAFCRRCGPGAGRSVTPSLLLRRPRRFSLPWQPRSYSFLIRPGASVRVRFKLH